MKKSAFNMKQKYMSLIITFIMLVVGIFPSNMAYNSYAVDDVTNLLSNKTIIVKQNGSVIGESDLLTPTDPISIALSFGVPVMADVEEGNTNYVKKGDTATFDLAEGFSLVSASGPFDLTFGGVKIGTLNITTDAGTKKVTANIVFDGDDEVFDTAIGESWTDIKCEFAADLAYAGEGSGSETKDYQVAVLDKTFTVRVPALPVMINGLKTGVRNGQYIDWKVMVDAQQGGTSVDLSGYTFSDDLLNVGALEGSFKMGTDIDGLGAVEIVPTVENANYTYVFPANTIGPVYIFYTTKIDDAKFMSNSSNTITNTAIVSKDSVQQWSGSKSITFDSKWIEKEAAVVDKDSRTITWAITVNHLGATLPGATIVDVLSDKLTFASAEWAKWTIDDATTGAGHWGAFENIVPTTDGGNGYALYSGGEPSLTTKAMLRITATVNGNVQIDHEIQTITNQAYLYWDSQGQIGSGNVSATIGMNPISKSVGAGGYNPTNHTIPWTITVKKSDINVDLRVMDLLVYGSSFDKNANYTVEGNADVSDLRHVTAEDIKLLSPEYHQRYLANSFTSATLGAVVYTIKNELGDAVADLVVVTKADNTGIPVTDGDQSFAFSSEVTNPNIYAKNGSTTLYNTATLFSANAVLNQSRKSVSANSRMLTKNMLSVADALDPEANKNASSASDTAGFNYVDKSVVFRLYVNENALSDVTNDLTANPSVVLGKVTVKDTLPAGWVFTDVTPGNPYLIYEGTRAANGVVTAGAAPADMTFLSSDFSQDGLVSFTFDTLTKPYVILVRAMPTEATQANYFDGNKVTNVVNTLSLTSENWSSGVSATQNVKISSEIVKKTVQLPAVNGTLNWTIEYKPYNLSYDSLRIEDTLPNGLDLKTNASGELDLTSQNIEAFEMNLNPNGTYTLGNSVPLVVGDNLSYDATTRKLIFNIPNPQKAYRFNYKTDINGDAGSALTNSVKLIGSDVSETEVNRSYTVSSADVSATMVRSGWVEVTKHDKNASPLSGAEFTIFTADGSKIFRKGVTNASGVVLLRGLPVGTYLLKETNPPAGYDLLNQVYTVVVTNEGGVTATSIDGKTGANSNKVTVVNYQSEDFGKLLVEKTVTGNAGDRSKLFDFTITLGDATNATFSYVGKGGKSDGTLKFTAGVATFTLKHGEGIEIKLLKNATYTVTESNYSAAGYVTTIVGDANGQISADDLAKVTFTNARNIYTDEEPTTEPSTVPTTEPSTEPSTEPTSEVTTESSTEPTRPSSTENKNTEEGTPVDGEVKVPEGGGVDVSEPPTNGKVTVDENGKWTYTPDPGYIGKDRFKVIITNPDGSFDDLIIDIDVEPIPLGGMLPQTGQTSSMFYWVLGFILVLSGSMIKIINRRNRVE
ncbi:DUF7601 domain-containing protein [Fusibacter bizertensis]